MKEDKAHKQIDKNLAKFEKALKQDYINLYNELKRNYLTSLKEARKKESRLTGQALIDFRKQQLVTSTQAKARIKSLARIINQWNTQSIQKLNAQSMGTYLLGFNATPATRSNIGISFSLLNEDMLKTLIEKQPDLLPKAKLNKNKDLNYNFKKIQKEFLSGIESGDDIRKLAKRLLNVTGSNYTNAVRDSRTITTRVENQGRNDRFNRDKAEVEKYGYTIKKVWIATKDDRTRPHHRELDGTYADERGYFKYGLRYPADPNADPSEIWNCRCSLGERMVKI